MKANKQIYIFLAFAAVVVLYHFFGYIGHYGYDDLHYAKLANDFKNGMVDYSDHYSFRITIILLTAISYMLLGISDFASSLPSIFLTLAILFLVYDLIKEKGDKTIIIGLALTTLSNWFIFYSDKLMPDIYLAFSVFLVLYIIHQYRYKNKKNHVFVFSLLVGFALLFGFMTKGTIILILPLLVYYFIVDIFKKQHTRFWIYTIASGFVIFLLYFLIIWLLTGNLFQRFEAIVDNSYLNPCSYDKQPLAILFERIGYQFFQLIIYQGMATGFIFIIAYLIGKRSLKNFKMADSFSFWISSAFILLLSSNFMTISLTSYSPLCLDPRHYLFLIPVVAIPAAIILNDFIELKTYKISILAVTALVAVISFFIQKNIAVQLYIPLLLLLLIYLFIKSTRLSQNIFIALLMLVLSAKPFTMVQYAQKVNYTKQKKIFIRELLNSNDSTIIITNPVQKRLGDYYMKFAKNRACTIADYNEFKYDPADARTKILMLNWYTRYLSTMDYNDLPYYAKNISAKNKLLFQDKELNMSMYEMTDFSIPDQTGKLLLKSTNDFEKTARHWNQQNENLSHEIKYEGKASNQMSEYSSTFEYYIDSLDLTGINKIYINCNVYCYFKEPTSSNLVISIENKEGTYLWQGLDITKYIRAYSNWWPVTHEVSINKSELKENSKIKVYLWNKDQQLAFADNFKVVIYGYN